MVVGKGMEDIMRLVIVRHGDPNYEKDTLTEVGVKEAKLAAEYISSLDVKDFYVSPLGRAQDTAAYTLNKMKRTAQTHEWLREFQGQIVRPDFPDRISICWDWLPQDMEKDLSYYDKDRWMQTDIMRAGNVREEYEKVCVGIDEILKNHGYEREGLHYKVVEPNSDVLVFFCHFGVESAILSHLLNVSPMIMWHGFCAAPSTITTVYTEERRKGIASFRVTEFGSSAHLYKAGEKPSFSARFCECYDFEDERHD